MAYSLLLAGTCSSRSGPDGGVSTDLFGIGPCLKITTSYVSENYVVQKKIDQSIEIYWLNLFGNIAGFYVAALVMTHIAGKYSRWLFAIVILTLFLAFLGSTIWSRNYWGYFMSRPGLDARVKKWERVLTVTCVSTQAESDESKVFIADPGCSVADRIKDGRNDRYYCLDARALIALEDSGKLPDSPDHMEAELLRSLHGRLDSEGLLIEGEPGYDEAKILRGTVIEALGADKKRYVFVAVKGYEVSNDHRPYYEFLFQANKQTSDLKLLSRKQFFYDVAGIEGFEWPVMFLYYSGIGLLISIPTTSIFLSFVRLLRNLKASKPENRSVLSHLRWGILFSCVYFVVALSCYLAYLSKKQQYGMPVYVFYYSSLPVYTVYALLLRFLQNHTPFSCFHYNKSMFVPIVLFFTTILYFWVGQGLGCMLSRFRKKKTD